MSFYFRATTYLADVYVDNWLSGLPRSGIIPLDSNSKDVFSRATPLPSAPITVYGDTDSDATGPSDVSLTLRSPELEQFIADDIEGSPSEFGDDYNDDILPLHMIMDVLDKMNVRLVPVDPNQMDRLMYEGELLCALMAQ